MIRAVMWDNDGTIINSEKIYQDVTTSVLENYGVSISPSHYSKHLGLPMDEVIKNLQEELMIKVPFDRIRQDIRDAYKLLGAQDIPLNEHVISVLTELKQQYSMALVSNARLAWVTEILDTNNLHEYFDTVVTRDQVPQHKPAPDPYLEALKRLAVNADEAVAIEDSETGFTSAKEARVAVIGYRSHHNLQVDFSLADYVIDDMREIPKILEKLNS